MNLPAELRAALAALPPERSVVVCTGAGVSAESGIPTFRGPEGYWRVGSKVHHPQSMATWTAFSQMPREVWRWYLYRKTVCDQAQPNPGHEALVRMEAALGERFCLITQNVDGLHLRAGSSPARTLEVHGNLREMRRAAGGAERSPIPEGLVPQGADEPLTDAAWERLVFPDGARARPNVLWFDETYDEEVYRADSAMRAASRAGLFIVAGTSGSTTLAVRAAVAAARAGAIFIDVNPDDNPFRDLAAQLPSGFCLAGPSGRWLPRLAEALGA